jgi:hypothetical protein
MKKSWTNAIITAVMELERGMSVRKIGMGYPFFFFVVPYWLVSSASGTQTECNSPCVKRKSTDWTSDNQPTTVMTIEEGARSRERDWRSLSEGDQEGRRMTWSKCFHPIITSFESTHISISSNDDYPDTPFTYCSPLTHIQNDLLIASAFLFHESLTWTYTQTSTGTWLLK